MLHSNGEEIRMSWNNATQLDLHANRVFIPVEFAGVGVAMLLFVSVVCTVLAIEPCVGCQCLLCHSLI